MQGLSRMGFLQLETQIELAKRIKIASEVDAETLIGDAREVGRMINGLVGR